MVSILIGNSKSIWSTPKIASTMKIASTYVMVRMRSPLSPEARKGMILVKYLASSIYTVFSIRAVSWRSRGITSMPRECECKL
jgi:hypothetical protein